MPTAATKRLRSARQPGRRLPTASTTYVALDCPQRALAAIEHAVAIYRTQGDRHGLCYALFNMAICCDALRETARKAVIYEEQLPLARAVGDVQLETVVLSQLGHTYAKLGIASRGLAYFDQAIALLEQQGVRAGQYTPSWVPQLRSTLPRVTTRPLPPATGGRSNSPANSATTS